MGNSKFRLSDMIPNAWFYKLKDMGMRGKIHNSYTYSIRKKQTKTSPSSAAPPSPNPKNHHHHYPRKSYYFTRDLIPTCDQTFHTNSPLSTKSPHARSPDPPPRKSSKQRVALSRRTTATTSSRSSPKMVTTTSSVSAGCSCRASLWTNSDSPPLDCSASPSDTSSQELFCSHSFPPEFRSDRILAAANDVHVINVDNKSVQNTNQLENPNMFDEMSDLHLPPIITKPPSKFSKNGFEKEEDIKKKKDVINNPTTKNIRRRRISAKNEETDDAAAAANGSFSEKQSITSSTTIKEQSKNNTTNSVRRNNYINSVTSPGGIRLRVNSPRIVSRRKSIGSSSISSNYSPSLSRSNNNRGGAGRRSLSDSLAIVKSSFDPQKDFRESMVEMIMENNIKGSKDLEDLLACYLSLNADEYHELIIMVFKQLWFDLTHITRPKNNN